MKNKYLKSNKKTTSKCHIILFKGEFTPENQQRLKQEEDKEQMGLDPWKVCDRNLIQMAM